MTSDLKRLCEAAVRAYKENLGPEPYYDEIPPGCEAIVRAVLTELREVSDEMRDAADNTGWNDDGWRRDTWVEEHRAMLRRILAESATA